MIKYITFNSMTFFLNDVALYSYVQLDDVRLDYVSPVLPLFHYLF